jgi:hypothetical protein
MAATSVSTRSYHPAPHYSGFTHHDGGYQYRDSGCQYRDGNYLYRDGGYPYYGATSQASNFEEEDEEEDIPDVSYDDGPTYSYSSSGWVQT